MARSRKLPSGENRGRLPRLNETVAQALLKAFSTGAYIETACQFVGIARQTYYIWMDRGEAEIERVRPNLPEVDERLAELVELSWADFNKACFEPFEPTEWLFVAFRILAIRARATAELRALSEIQKAGLGPGAQWQALAWFLEHTFPEKYGRRNMVVTGDKNADPVQVEGTVSVEAVEEAIQRLRDGK